MDLIEKNKKAYELWEYAYKRLANMAETPTYYVLFNKLPEWKQKKEFAIKVENRLFNYYLNVNKQYLVYLKDKRRLTELKTMKNILQPVVTAEPCFHNWICNKNTMQYYCDKCNSIKKIN